jgi:hypothetical protein
MLNWLFFTIPANRRVHYFFCLCLVIWIIPEYLFKMQFTMLMQFINFITFDILYYRMLLIESQFKDGDDD